MTLKFKRLLGCPQVVGGDVEDIIIYDHKIFILSKNIYDPLKQNREEKVEENLKIKNVTKKCVDSDIFGLN